jgi:hypothetical protein
MRANEILDFDSTQDDFVRAVMYPFAMADYEGLDSVSINAVTSSPIFEGVSADVINEALETAQNAGLIDWDQERVGAIRLTELGLAKFFLVRNDFFSDERNVSLRDAVSQFNSSTLRRSEPYQLIKASCPGLGALPGQTCPLSGQWQARRLEGKKLVIQEGEMIPFPEYDQEDKPVIWYLIRESSVTAVI